MSEESTLLPDWETFKQDYVISGTPVRYVVREDPAAEFFLDAGGTRFGALFAPEGSAAPAIPLREVRCEEITVHGERRLSVWSDQPALYEKFYQLLGEVTAAVVQEGRAPTEALAQAVAEWDALLDRPNLMSVEAQAGLFGELWVLERLTSSMGIEAVSSWTGPGHEAHDFRVSASEIEVKTTGGTRRVHVINGVDQLQPSPGVPLYLLSLRLADAGSGGLSLPEAVERVETRLGGNSVALGQFHDRLSLTGYREQDAVHYTRRLRLRDGARLVPVLDGFPRITSEVISAIPPRFAPARFGRITYEIEVEGLGVEDGSPAFLEILPGGPDR